VRQDVPNRYQQVQVLAVHLFHPAGNNYPYHIARQYHKSAQ